MAAPWVSARKAFSGTPLRRHDSAHSGYTSRGMRSKNHRYPTSPAVVEVEAGVAVGLHEALGAADELARHAQVGQQPTALLEGERRNGEQFLPRTPVLGGHHVRGHFAQTRVHVDNVVHFEEQLTMHRRGQRATAKPFQRP